MSYDEFSSFYWAYSMKLVEEKDEQFLSQMEDIVMNDEKKRQCFGNMNKEEVIFKKKKDEPGKGVKSADKIVDDKENDEDKSPKEGEENKDNDEEEEEEEEEIPDEIKKMPVEQQQRAIIKLSLKTMLTGTLMVILFSDPMVGVLSAFGKIIGVPAF